MNHPRRAARGISAEAEKNTLVNRVQVVGGHRLAVDTGGLNSDLCGCGLDTPDIGIEHGKQDEARELEEKLKYQAHVVGRHHHAVVQLIEGLRVDDEPG